MAPQGGAASEPDRRAVLVVDDEPLVRLNAVYLFEDMGFEVLEAGNGAEALKVLEARPDVTLLFSDCRMPVMTGPELAEVVTERWPHVRIVLVTGYVNVVPKNWPVLWKPYTARDVERLVAE